MYHLCATVPMPMPMPTVPKFPHRLHPSSKKGVLEYPCILAAAPLLRPSLGR